MDTATEAVNLRRQLEKAVSSEDVERMGDVLNSLGNVEVTLPVLRESKVGATVSKLKKHANVGVSNSAKALVKKWKRVAEASGVQGGAAGAGAGAVAAGKMGKLAPGSSGKGSASPSGSQGGKGPVGSGASAGATPSNAKSAAASTGLDAGALKAASASSSSSSSSSAPLSRQSSTSSTSALSRTVEVDRILAEDALVPLQFKMRQKLFDALILGDQEDDRLPAAHAAAETERAMERNNPLGSKKENYLDKARQLVFNLKKNEQLRRDVREGLVAPETLVVMTSTELMSKEKREAMDKAVSDRTEARMLDWYDKNQDKINKQCGIKETEGMFECGRCKSTKTTYTQKQTRSADEPMTTFVTCSNCKNRWKFC